MKSVTREIPIALCILVLAALPLSAAAPAESCSDGPEVGPVALPLVGSSSPTTADFVLTGSGCLSGATVDSVACFTPTSSCTVDLECATPIRGPAPGVEGVGTTINLFAGPCADDPGPAGCVASAGGGGFVSLASQALTGGQHYCVVCGHTFPSGTQVDVSITLSSGSGSCGDMPVELVHFSVQR